MFYEKVFRALNKAGVRYLVPGGIAVNLHGIPRMTQDLDIIVELTPANVRKLVKVLTLLGYRCKLPVNPELISDPAIRHQWINEKNMKVFNFYHKDIPVQEIDILVTAPVKVESAFKRAIVKRAGKLVIPLVGLKDLIKMKEAAGRPQDLSDIQMLKLFLKAK